jgi:hypothetical protein
MTDRYKESIQGARDCVERNKDGGVYLPDLLVVIDSQQTQIDKMLEDLQFRTNQVIEQQAEIEEWKKINQRLYDEMEERRKEDIGIAKGYARIEAIKEFWNRLQGIAYQSSDWSHGEHPMVVELDDVEEIYDEMVGEDK